MIAYIVASMIISTVASIVDTILCFVGLIVTMPLAMLVFGPLSDALKLEPILAATGAAMFILVLLVPLNRRLRNPASAEER